MIAIILLIFLEQQCQTQKAFIFPLVEKDNRLFISAKIGNETQQNVSFAINNNINQSTICKSIFNNGATPKVILSQVKLQSLSDKREYNGQLIETFIAFNYMKIISSFLMINNSNCTSELSLVFSRIIGDKITRNNLINYLFYENFIIFQVITVDLISNELEIGEDNSIHYTSHCSLLNYTFIKAEGDNLKIPFSSFDIIVGKTGKSHSFAFSEFAVIDFSQPFIMVPYELRDQLFNKFFFVTSYDELPCNYMVKDQSYDVEVVCTSNIFDSPKYKQVLNEVTFTFGNEITIHIDKAHMFIKESRGYKLIFEFSQEVKEWVFGYEVFKGYALKFDYETYSVGFGTESTVVNSNNEKIKLIIIIFVILMLFYIIIIYFIKLKLYN